ncbi:STAS domain-containing protein [Dactylosporangium sp. CA-092794]|uniref:STAS domain-containing protein n=1 Tax=Dactylosporangium sp. CA-092794 TaxID=3239929 RepID=UPI003D8AC128
MPAGATDGPRALVTGGPSRGPVSPRLRVHREDHAGLIVVRLAGRFVALTALSAESCLARALSDRPPRIVLEAHRVTEMDATAAMMVQAAGQVARDHAGFLRIAAPSEAVAAALLAQPSTAVTVYRSLADALRLWTLPADPVDPGPPRPGTGGPGALR